MQRTPNGRTASTFRRDSLPRLAWAAWAIWAATLLSDRVTGQWITSIFKNFRLSDRLRLQFRAEAFNVFNHTNFQLGGTDMNSLNDPFFGQAGGTFNPRQLQFGIKLTL